MTEQEQRICIAEACGFQRWFGGNDVILCKPRDNRQRQYWLDSGSVIVDSPVDSMREVPDYLNDLNAMFIAWRDSLDEQQQWEFCDELGNVIKRACPKSDIYRQQALEANATAAQRAEAFLKTLGLWKD